MATTPFDSALYRDLFQEQDIARLLSDTAEIRAMLMVEGALARAQGACGLIPDTAAAAIGRAALEVQIDPAALSTATALNAVPVPAFVAAFRKAMGGPEHAQYVHFGATSQDIMDTALMLRMRQVLVLIEAQGRQTLSTLGSLAAIHAETCLAGRTYGQNATVTSFGAIIAGWGWPIKRVLDKLPDLRAEVLAVSLAGAAGTLSAMGAHGPSIRAAMAQDLGLADPGASWHSARDRIASLASWMTQLSGALGKMGEDLIVMTQSGIDEVSLGGAGGSSTMPQKQNPVQPSVLVALARLVMGLNSVIQGAAIHRQQRDGAAWMTEWLGLSQLCMATGKATAISAGLSRDITARQTAMLSNLDEGLGLIYAEALSFELVQLLPRPEAQARVKTLCKEAGTTATPLENLAKAAFPDVTLDHVFEPQQQLGQAAADARAFAKAVQTG